MPRVRSGTQPARQPDQSALRAREVIGSAWETALTLPVPWIAQEAWRMNAEAPSFERDIKPLFRPKDIESMSAAFDLSSYEDVRTNADRIYNQLAKGSMPCDGAWPPEEVERFRGWIDAGTPQ